ncbi:MAG: hypothetical protein UX47_C0005G0056 [Candidatus Collierbacteria bacterium GW2011_GWA2_46_26]|uniref:DUF5659 domain-containing protein n=1 Tax=Candidatus Collierbacteria bacterium GW2011_GWA2_46_26 TaxID=1618381 RepID=A0A0G1PKA4_9BACT|nr:MAG: hypothetical protein UW29_C0008G0056 [Candidatus Collierbacteria bacterium GW2011_GWC2_44_13]KKU33254.1 MAG: hypothetical protein UX47_C0005G0056 [Candidatus Collierbacteria bacterium GW2011_GWA2_46_26]
MLLKQANMNINNFFVSADLPLVTTISLYYPIDALDRSSPPRVQFLFKRDGDLDKLVEAFWKDELRVSPQIFFNQLKIIKSRIHNN